MLPKHYWQVFLSFQIKGRKGLNYIVQVIYGQAPKEPEEVWDEDKGMCAHKK